MLVFDLARAFELNVQEGLQPFRNFERLLRAHADGVQLHQDREALPEFALKMIQRLKIKNILAPSAWKIRSI